MEYSDSLIIRCSPREVMATQERSVGYIESLYVRAHIEILYVDHALVVNDFAQLVYGDNVLGFSGLRH